MLNEETVASSVATVDGLNANQSYIDDEKRPKHNTTAGKRQDGRVH
jgi:hypothetical protein